MSVDNYEELIYDYTHGMSIKELQLKYHFGQAKITNILDKNGIHRYDNHERSVLKATKYKYTYQEVVDIILDNYLNKKMGQIACGKELGIGPHIVKTILDKNNVEVRDFSQAIAERNKKYRKYNNNPSYFKMESHNMAYILGFIAADGSISKNSNDIKITLAQKDKELLKKIKEEIKIEAPIKDSTTSKGYDISCLDWTCEDHKKDLAKYTIIPQKTFLLKPPTMLNKEYIIDYIRGYFDGDGSVNLISSTDGRGNGSLRWQICSAVKEVLQFFIDFLEQEYGIPPVSILQQSRQNGPIYYFQYSSSATRMIYKILYTPNSLYLERKKNHFEEILNKVAPLKDN